jgi:hypothetical protein
MVLALLLALLLGGVPAQRNAPPRSSRRPAARRPPARRQPTAPQPRGGANKNLPRAYEHLPDANATIEHFRAAVEAHLRPLDYEWFSAATGGTSVAELLAPEAWSGTKTLIKEIMSVNAKFVHTALNGRGLHVLRVLLSKRISEYVREQRGLVRGTLELPEDSLNVTTLAATLRDEGILIIPNAQKIAGPRVQDMLRGESGLVRRVLETASGFRSVGVADFGPFSTYVHTAKDVQNYMHDP